MRTLNIIVSSLLLGAVSCAFPADFAWGVATASYQIEGAFDIEGKGRGIWDDFCDIPGRVANGDSGKVADDFYHKYQEDIDMMVTLGFKYFRMSLSWPRILPDGTIDNVNQQGVDFYNTLFDALIEAGITPFVTMYHWDLPSGLMQDKSKDGWLSPSIQDSFNDYADFLFKTFGSKITHWITFNEPQSFTWIGYGSGIHAPGRCSPYISADCASVGDGGDTPTEPYIAAHNVILAHGKAVQTYRTKYQADQGGIIGMCTQSEFAYPWDPSNQDDIDAIETKLQFDFGWYNDPIHFGKYSDAMVNLITGNRLPTFTEEESAMLKGSYDFLGLNHYTSRFVKYTGVEGTDWSNDGRFTELTTNVYGEYIGGQAQSNWLMVVPEGLRGVLGWIDKRYDHQPIYIFENGVSVPGETQLSLEAALHDDFRVDYYAGYINAMQEAIEIDGVDVRGYFAWSLMDNFEWADGYNVRFGMVYVDYTDLSRHIKDSGYWYSEWIKNNTTPAIEEMKAAQPVKKTYGFLDAATN